MIKEQRAGEDILTDLGFDIKYLSGWRTRWRNLKGRTKARGSASCLLTFRQYMKLAKKAGLQKPSQIGKSNGQFQMSRLQDKGDYEWGNCRFITVEANREEKKRNGGSVRGALKSAETMRNDTEADRAKRSAISEARQKRFVLISPSGKRYTGSNIKDFCERHKLHRGAVAGVCRGERNHYKGWIGEYV